MQRVVNGVDGSEELRFDLASGATWLHMVNPDTWAVYDWEPCRLEAGVVVEVVGEGESLIKAAIGKKTALLSFDDLCRIARKLQLPLGVQNSRGELLEGIATEVSNGDREFIDRVMASVPEGDGCALLVEDPLFEAAYEDCCGGRSRVQGRFRFEALVTPRSKNVVNSSGCHFLSLRLLPPP